MLYRVAADIVVLLHFAWIIFLVLGALIGRKHRSLKMMHIGGLVFAALMQTFGWYCPLTHLDVWLRRRHNPALSYEGSFIVHYIEELVYVQVSPYLIHFLTVVIIVFSAYLYVRRPD
ncbi:MAG: DUF2784 domain-containing protein [Pseudomonadota bacterium]